MKKFIVGFLACVLALNIYNSAFAIDRIEVVKTFSEKNVAPNRVWVGTFQLVWNDFMDEILKGPVKFISGEQKVAKALNKQEFKVSMLSPDSYYKTYGKPTLELKGQIETAIMEKFGEKSEILEQINWSDPDNAVFLYTMLKKEFKFVNRFTQLPSGDFGPYHTDYFGINESGREILYSNVRVLFYDSPSEFAVALNTRTNDEVYIYRTEENKPFNSIYKDMNKKTAKYKGSHEFMKGDKIKVPYVAFKKDVNFDELCNRIIKNTDEMYFEKALQTVDFDLNESGVKLKSEAALDVNFVSFLPQSPKEGRNLEVTNTFYIFMKEKDKGMPYFAARVKDLILFNPQKQSKKSS